MDSRKSESCLATVSDISILIKFIFIYIAFSILALLLRNLPADIDEDRLLSLLSNVTALDIVRIMVARNPSTEATRGYAYVQMASATEATQLLTSLTTLTKLTIDGQDGMDILEILLI